MAARQWLAAVLLAGAVLPALAAPAAPQGFNRVTSQDGTDIWAVGDAGTVYRSLDGGVSWGSYPMGSAEHRDVAAKGTHVWVVDADGTLWTSGDGGFSFASTAPAGGAPLYAVSFASETTGWIAGAGGVILKTTDGGTSWAPQTSGTVSDLLALRFHGPLEGWGCGAHGALVHTTDGGTSWTASAPFTFTKDFYDVDFDGPTVCVAGTYAFCGRSTNGGASWTNVNLRIASHSDVNGLAVLPGGALWICGGGGFLRRTTDGGRTWFYPRHPVMTGLTDVFFADANHGWACAARSKLVARTTDGGATWSVPGGGAYTCTWSQKLAAGTATIRGNTLVIDPVNRNKLYCVQGRTVFASWNLGDSWSAIATISGTGTRTNAFLVSATDTLTWLAIVRDPARVTRTTDGGSTWTTPLSIVYTEYGLPLEQDPDKPDNVYFGPEDGRIWKSTDFGANWTQLANPGFRSPDDIVVVADTVGILYVSDGVTGSGNAQIWKSSDGGLTWVSKRTLTGSEVPTIGASWLNKTIAYATDWSSGGVQKTSDVGETWPNVASTSSAWGTDIAKDDPNVAMYAVYSGGTSYLTRDEGATFQSAALSGSNYAVLAYDRGTYLAHQSNGVWKVTLTQADMPVNNVQLLTLLAPNGGESWTYGATESVTWSCQNLALARIEFRTDSLAPWQPVVASTPGPAGAYAWPIPAAPTTWASVRISDANDGMPLDLSDAPFSILVPAIAPAPAALDYGEVGIGASKTDSIRIANDGTATLVISNVALAGSGPFTPTRTSFSIPPGAAETLAVVFEPIASQAYQDTLVIASNAPSAPTRIPLAGIGEPPTGVGPGDGRAPLRFALGDNVPNPFSAKGTVIAYTIAEECDVSLTVYSALGQKVATLVRERQRPGRYAVRFPGTGASLARGFASTLPSGVYFCRLRAGGFLGHRRIVLIR